MHLNQTTPDDMSSVWDDDIYTVTMMPSTTIATTPYTILKLALCVVSLIVFLSGVIGNGLAAFIMLRKPLCSTSTNVYMGVLAIYDLILLCVGPLDIGLNILSQKRIVLSVYRCKGAKFTYYFTTFVSAWMVVAMTIERWTSVHFPLKAKIMCTVKREIKVIITINILVIPLGCLTYYSFDVFSFANGSKYCDIKLSWYSFYDGYDIVILSLYSLIPSIVITGCNILIIYRMSKAAQSMQGEVHNSTMAQTARKTSITLLTISFTFIICTLPISLYQIFKWRLGFHGIHIAVYYTTSMVMFSYHAINFYLYCMTAERFRNELKKQFWGRSQSTNIS